MIFLVSIKLAFIFISAVAADYANATVPRSTITLAPTYAVQPLTSVSTYNDLTTTIDITNTFYSTLWYTPITSVFSPSITTETLERTTIYETTQQDTIYTVTSTVISTKQITFIQPTETDASSIRHSRSEYNSVTFPSPGVKAAAAGHFSTISPTGTVNPSSASSPRSDNDRVCTPSTKIITVSAAVPKEYVTVTVTVDESRSSESIAPSQYTTAQSFTLKSSSDTALSLSSESNLSHGSTASQPSVTTTPYSGTSPAQPLRSTLSYQSTSAQPSAVFTLSSSTSLSSTLETVGSSVSHASEDTKPSPGTPSTLSTGSFAHGSTAGPSTISGFASDISSSLHSGSITSYQSTSTQATISSPLSFISPPPYSGSNVPSTTSQPSMTLSSGISSSSPESSGLATSQQSTVPTPSGISSQLSSVPSLSHVISARSSISPSLSSSISTLSSQSPQSLVRYPFLANGTSSFIA